MESHDSSSCNATSKPAPEDNKTSNDAVLTSTNDVKKNFNAVLSVEKATTTSRSKRRCQFQMTFEGKVMLFDDDGLLCEMYTDVSKVECNGEGELTIACEGSGENSVRLTLVGPEIPELIKYIQRVLPNLAEGALLAKTETGQQAVNTSVENQSDLSHAHVEVEETASKERLARIILRLVVEIEQCSVRNKQLWAEKKRTQEIVQRLKTTSLSGAHACNLAVLVGEICRRQLIAAQKNRL